MFHRLGAIARHLGRKAVTFGEGALGKLHHIGSKIHQAAGKIPVIGGAVQGAMSAAYNTRIPFVGVSAKDAFEGAKKAVSVGKSVTSEDPRPTVLPYSLFDFCNLQSQ